MAVAKRARDHRHGKGPKRRQKEAPPSIKKWPFEVKRSLRLDGLPLGKGTGKAAGKGGTSLTTIPRVLIFGWNLRDGLVE